MNKLKLGILCITSIFTSNIMANTLMLDQDEQFDKNGDSVMTPGTMSKPDLVMKKKNGNSSNYMPVQEIEYNPTACPSGYSSNRGSFFYTGQKLMTKFYENGKLVRTISGDWTPTNENCFGTEKQTVDCPGGYQGNIIQQRNVSYNTSGYTYDNWSEASNSCVIKPVTPMPIPTSSIAIGDIPRTLYSGVAGGGSYVSMTIGRDGRWNTFESTSNDFTKGVSRSGQWLKEGVPSDFEIGVSGYRKYSDPGSCGPASGLSDKTVHWVNLGTGATQGFSTQEYLIFDMCYQYGDTNPWGMAVVEQFTITIRSVNDHSIAQSFNVKLMARAVPQAYSE